MKKLEINCGTCDATNLREEMLAEYDAVEINCGTLLVSPAGQAALLSRQVEMNTGGLLTVPEGAELMSRMGDFTLRAADVQTRPAFLQIMGNLILEPGAGPAADSFVAIHVIGSLLCARSDRSPKITVMGVEKVYPDGYLYMDDLTLDKTFRLRFGGKKVYARGTVTVGDLKELEALAQAGTKVLCGKLAVPEGLLEAALKVAEPEKPEDLAVYPDGWAYLEGQCRLTKRELRRGKKLWIDGSLAVERENMALFAGLEGLYVTGTALVPEELEARMEELDPDCGDIITYRGALMRGKEAVNLTRALIERHSFVTLYGCDCVMLDRELTPEEIEAGLAILHCDCVVCTPSQEAAVRSVAEDVDAIDAQDPDAKTKEDDPEDTDPDTVCINSGTYKF